MTDHYVTDAKHLLSTTQRGIAALEALGHAWIREDQAATFPTASGDTPTSGGGTSDPTVKVATSEVDRYRDRDHIGRTLVRLVGMVEAEVSKLEPRHTGGPCDCCESETATHGRRDDGAPAECWGCWTFRRKMGFRCDDAIHEGRPTTNMCQCPAECCPGGCPDVADEKRKVTGYSDRCARRMAGDRRALRAS